MISEQVKLCYDSIEDGLKDRLVAQGMEDVITDLMLEEYRKSMGYCLNR